MEDGGLEGLIGLWIWDIVCAEIVGVRSLSLAYFRRTSNLKARSLLSMLAWASIRRQSTLRARRQSTEMRKPKFTRMLAIRSQVCAAATWFVGCGEQYQESPLLAPWKLKHVGTDPTNRNPAHPPSGKKQKGGRSD